MKLDDIAEVLTFVKSVRILDYYVPVETAKVRYERDDIEIIISLLGGAILKLDNTCRVLAIRTSVMDGLECNILTTSGEVTLTSQDLRSVTPDIGVLGKTYTTKDVALINNLIPNDRSWHINFAGASFPLYGIKHIHKSNRLKLSSSFLNDKKTRTRRAGHDYISFSFDINTIRVIVDPKDRSFSFNDRYALGVKVKEYFLAVPPLQTSRVYHPKIQPVFSVNDLQITDNVAYEVHVGGSIFNIVSLDISVYKDLEGNPYKRIIISTKTVYLEFNENSFKCDGSLVIGKHTFRIYSKPALCEQEKTQTLDVFK